MSDPVTALQRAAAAQRTTRDLRQLRGEYDRVAGRIRGFVAMYTTSDADARVVADMVLAEIRPVMQGNLELSHHLVERMEETEGLREEATKLRAWTARAADKAEAQRAALERLAQAQEQERTTAKMDILARKDQEMRHRRAWRGEVEATLAQQLRDVAAHLKRAHDAELAGVVKRFESEIREREGTLRAQFEAQLAALEQEIQLQRALRSPLRSQRWERGSGERVQQVEQVERVEESEGIRYVGDGRGDRHHADTYRGHDSGDERGDTYRGRRDGGRTGAQHQHHQPLRRPFAEPVGSGEDADSGSSGDATVDGKGSDDRSRRTRGYSSEGGGSEDGGDSSRSPVIRGVTNLRARASDVLRRTTAKHSPARIGVTTGNDPGTTTDTTGSPGTTGSSGSPGTDRRIVTGMGWAMRPNLVPRYTDVNTQPDAGEDRGDSGGGGEWGESKERNGGSPRSCEHGYNRSPARRLGYDGSRRGASPVGVHSSAVSSGEASPVGVQVSPGGVSPVNGSPDSVQPVTDTAAWARRKAAEDFEASVDTDAEDREWRRATAWVREGGRSSNTYRSIFAVKGSLAASVT